jgi:hypothetical protein
MDDDASGAGLDGTSGAEIDGAIGAGIGGATSDKNLGSPGIFSPTEGHSLNSPQSNLMSYFFSPHASTIVPSIPCLLCLFD